MSSSSVRSLLRVLAACVAAAVLLGLPLGRAAVASAEEPGAAPVHEIHLDPGALAEGTPTTVRVARGDTLSEIAKARLGSAKRVAEIQRINPGLDARTLKVGQVLKLPPRRVTASAGWLELYVALPGGPAHPIAAGQPVTLPVGPVRVFAVPSTELKRLHALAGKRGLTETLLFGDTQVARSGLFDVGTPEGRDLVRAVTHLEVTGRRGSTLEVLLREQQVYGATGRRVTSPEGEEGSSPLAPLLLVLAGLALFGLVAFAVRRMAAPDSDGAANGP